MSFNKDVIERSHVVPVVVDFWAPWCGPCRVLGPTIEQLAAESNGTWELVKINTEEHQEIAYEYGIRSIPNVKMFHGGKIVSEFAGALPRHQILQWLDENLPSTDKEEWKEVVKQLPELTVEEAIASLNSFLNVHADHVDARHELAKYMAFRDPVTAGSLLEDVKMGDPNYDIVEDVRSLGELATLSDTNHDGLSEELRQASVELNSNKIEDAVQRIIEVVKKDKNIHNELPRRAAIAIFRLLGNQHPVTKKYRRIFDMVLY